MEITRTISRTLRGSLLITGTTIGAGMLGIPIITAPSGLAGAFLMTTLVWLFMLLTGLLLLEATLAMPKGTNFFALSEKYLGKSGKCLTGGLFIFLYTLLLIAYFAAGGPLLATLLGGSLSPKAALILFTLFFGVVIAISPKSIDRVNLFLSILMFCVLGAFFLIGIPSIEASNFSQGVMANFWMGAPILFGAFGYHNMIPSLVSYMEGDSRALRNSIVIGVTIPFVVYLLWQLLILGTIPKEMIESTMQQGLPITFALAEVIQNPLVIFLGQLFGFLAIVTSVLGVAFSYIDFLAEGFKTKAKGGVRCLLTLLTIGLPFGVALANPKIFEYALSIAGGFGEALINGVIPIALVASMRYVKNQSSSYRTPVGKWGLVALLGFAVWVMGIEFHFLFF